MACSSCGTGQILKVEGVSASRQSAPKSPPPRKFSSRKMIVRTVSTKPANDVDRYRA